MFEVIWDYDIGDAYHMFDENEKVPRRFLYLLQMWHFDLKYVTIAHKSRNVRAWPNYESVGEIGHGEHQYCLGETLGKAY